MIFQKADISEFDIVKEFYWNLIEEMSDVNDQIEWKKGIYPSDDFLMKSLEKGELFMLKEDDSLCACVILNSDYNMGYVDVPWSIKCEADEVLIPHALAVSPDCQGKGIGKRIVKEILDYAKTEGKKTVRLDILGTNTTAEKLYTGLGKLNWPGCLPVFFSLRDLQLWLWLMSWKRDCQNDFLKCPLIHWRQQQNACMIWDMKKLDCGVFQKEQNWH